MKTIKRPTIEDGVTFHEGPSSTLGKIILGSTMVLGVAMATAITVDYLHHKRYLKNNCQDKTLEMINSIPQEEIYKSRKEYNSICVRGLK